MKKESSALKYAAVALVAVLITAAAVYVYGYGEGETAGYNRGKTVAPAAVAAADTASITAKLNSSTWAFANNIAADGSVSAQVSAARTLWINNTDDDVDATSLSVRLVNPRTDTEGLHDNLETDSFEVSITVGGTTELLFTDRDYVEDGWYYGDLSDGAKLTVTVTITLKTAVAGTFQDGQTYDNCKLYVYQEDADSVDTVTFTVTT